VLDVGEQKLLVLLLVVDAEGDEGLERFQQLGIGRLEQPLNGRVDVAAVVEYLGHCRARDVSALRPAVPLPRVHVVRVEEESVRSSIGR
jgi:hypothetical protein